MRTEIDFLPPDQEAVHKRDRDWRKSLWFAGVVACGILLTDVALRHRIEGLLDLRTQTQLHSDSITLKTAHIDQLCRRHQETIDELARWSVPVEVPRATRVLDVILEARPDSIFLEQVEWRVSEPLSASGMSPTLRIGGTLHDLSDVVSFVAAMDDAGCLPELAVRQSGASNASRDRSVQSFVIESEQTRGGRR